MNYVKDMLFAPRIYSDLVYDVKLQYMIKVGCTDEMLAQKALKTLIDCEIVYYKKLSVFTKEIFNRSNLPDTVVGWKAS